MAHLVCCIDVGFVLKKNTECSLRPVFCCRQQRRPSLRKSESCEHCKSNWLITNASEGEAAPDGRHSWKIGPAAHHIAAKVVDMSTSIYEQLGELVLVVLRRIMKGGKTGFLHGSGRWSGRRTLFPAGIRGKGGK